MVPSFAIHWRTNPLPRPDNRLAAAMDIQFRIQCSHMIAHRIRRKLQARGDFLVGQPLTNEPQHITLTGRQLGEGCAGHLALMLFTLASFSIRVRLNQDASFITSSIAATSSSSERLRSVMFISTSK